MSTAFTVPQVAERLQIHPDHVRDLIRRGELSAFNIGGKRRPTYRVTDAALEGFQARRSVQGPEPKRTRERRPVRTFKRFV